MGKFGVLTPFERVLKIVGNCLRLIKPSVPRAPFCPIDQTKRPVHLLAPQSPETRATPRFPARHIPFFFTIFRYSNQVSPPTGKIKSFHAAMLWFVIPAKSARE
jgi:hypothetical protein